MEVYQIWLIAAIVLVIVEICTVGFGSICFAIGAGFAALVAGLAPESYTWQILVFAVVSLLTFIFLRPIVIKFFERNSKDVKTNVDALIGKKALVSEDIDSVAHTGRVKVDGDEWKAITEDGSNIEKGKEVEIISRDSIIVTVKSI